uniref:Putative secreted protein n=1 Tax=Ixodes ricinus TaxID=34613 RepID=A0A6B0V3R2_IXORI
MLRRRRLAPRIVVWVLVPLLGAAAAAPRLSPARDDGRDGLRRQRRNGSRRRDRWRRHGGVFRHLELLRGWRDMQPVGVFVRGVLGRGRDGNCRLGRHDGFVRLRLCDCSGVGRLFCAWLDCNRLLDGLVWSLDGSQDLLGHCLLDDHAFGRRRLGGKEVLGRHLGLPGGRDNRLRLHRHAFLAGTGRLCNLGRNLLNELGLRARLGLCGSGRAQIQSRLGGRRVLNWSGGRLNS